MSGVLSVLLGDNASAGGATYTGPGDIVAFTHWWGLRAYNAAGIGANCVDIIRASDSSTATFATIAGGGVNLSGIASFLTATTGKVSKLYDQVGTSHLLSGTFAPAITLSAIGSGGTGPAIKITFDASLPATLVVTMGGSQSQPFTLSTVAALTTAATHTAVAGTSSPALVAMGFSSNTPPNGYGYASTNTNTSNTVAVATAACINNFYNGASSNFNLNGTATTSINPGANALGTDFMYGGWPGVDSFGGTSVELGIINGGSGANNTSLASNQAAFWGT
jgi:hypothetical protein